MKEASPILITGVPRSGSSMIAAAIHACGAFGGMMSKRSMFCNDAISGNLVVPFMYKVQADSKGHWQLPALNIEVPNDWKQNVRSILKAEGYRSGPWMYKDSRSTLLWNVWNTHYPSARWIIVRRKSSDIVASCIQTGFMEAFKDYNIRQELNVETEKEGWMWLIHEYEKRWYEMIKANVCYKEIWPERMSHGDFDQFKEICRWAGLEYTDEAEKFILNLVKR